MILSSILLVLCSFPYTCRHQYVRLYYFFPSLILSSITILSFILFILCSFPYTCRHYLASIRQSIFLFLLWFCTLTILSSVLLILCSFPYTCRYHLAISTSVYPLLPLMILYSLTILSFILFILCSFPYTCRHHFSISSSVYRLIQSLMIMYSFTILSTSFVHSLIAPASVRRSVFLFHLWFWTLVCPSPFMQFIPHSSSLTCPNHRRRSLNISTRKTSLPCSSPSSMPLSDSLRGSRRPESSPRYHVLRLLSVTHRA